MFFPRARSPGCAEALAEGVSLTCGEACVSPAAAPGVPVIVPVPRRARAGGPGPAAARREQLPGVQARLGAPQGLKCHRGGVWCALSRGSGERVFGNRNLGTVSGG